MPRYDTVYVSLILSAGAVLGWPGATLAQETPPSDPRVTDPMPRVDPEVVDLVRQIGTIGSVDELLDALETADADVRTFQAKVMWDQRFRLQGDRHIRYGTLAFKVEPAAEAGGRPQRTFGVEFQELYIEGVRRIERSQWVFDGQWLIEKDFAQKMYTARRLARPGDEIDPLRLGEGPIPLPIGQRKADILRRYEVELLGSSEGIERPDANEANPEDIAEADERIAFVGDAYQLRLVPREAYQRSEEFREIRLWYERGSLRPRMVRTINRSGDESYVRLIDIRIDESLPAGAVDVDRPREADGWRVQIDEGRFAVEDERN